MRRLAQWVRPVLGAALALGAVLSSSTRAEAQEIQLTGPLAGAPAVRKLRMYREGRFELAPSISFSLLDEYRRTILAGARLQYNVKDWISFGVWGAYGVISSTTDLTDQIDQTAPRNTRTAYNVNHDANGKPLAFGDQTAKMQWVLAPQVQFAPFRGKLALFQKFFLDTDLYLHGGVAFIGLQERGDCGDAAQKACSDPASFALASRTAIAPTFGLGLNFYASDLVSVGMEYRALPFSWNRPGFDQRGAGNNGNFPNSITGQPKINSDDRTFKFNQMISISVGFSFPKPKVSD